MSAKTIIRVLLTFGLAPASWIGWIQGGDGSFNIRSSGETEEREERPTAGNDRESNIEHGNGSAMEAPRQMRWEWITVQDGLPSSKVFAVALDEDRVWAGTTRGLASIHLKEIKTYGVNEGLPFAAVTSLCVDPVNGDLWIGTLGGLARYSGGRFDVFTQLTSGLANDVVYEVAVDGAKVWAATATGLSCYDTRTKAWEIYNNENTLMHEPWTYGVSVAGDHVYVAVWGGGVVVLDQTAGTFREHRDPDGEMEIDLFRDDGLIHDVTSSISNAGGVMWVGTYFGLSRYDGRRWRTFSEKDSGLAGNFINQVRANETGVWVATDQGVSWFDSRTWHTWKPEDGEWTHRVTADGGPSRSYPVETHPPSSMVYSIALGASGEVWMGTAGGLARGDWRPRPSNSNSKSNSNELLETQ